MISAMAGSHCRLSRRFYAMEVQVTTGRKMMINRFLWWDAARGRMSALLAFVFIAGCVISGCSGSCSGVKPSEQTLLHVSYDPTRELFRAYNERFEEQNPGVRVEMSHGGSGSQSRAVRDGLRADLVSLALEPDIDVLASSGLLRPDWRTSFPGHSGPFYSTIVFLVREGNPRGLEDWSDLVQEGLEVVAPNPRTSGAARWIFVAAYGQARARLGEEGALSFIRAFYRQVPVLDSGARGASNTFARNGIGDVLLTWENEAFLLRDSMPDQRFEIVVPPQSIRAEPVVALVDQVVDARGTRALANLYAMGLYDEEVQQMAAESYYRPWHEGVLRQNSDRFPEVELFTVEEVAGSWADAQERFFSDGGLFDQIYEPENR